MYLTSIKFSSVKKHIHFLSSETDKCPHPNFCVSYVTDVFAHACKLYISACFLHVSMYICMYVYMRVCVSEWTCTCLAMLYAHRSNLRSTLIMSEASF